MQKLPAARMDILAALYIDDREETAISLASRIFPGDSTALLLRTAEGGIAGARVETALAECNTASGVKVMVGAPYDIRIVKLAAALMILSWNGVCSSSLGLILYMCDVLTDMPPPV